MPSRASGPTNSSIRSASGIQEVAARLAFDLLVGPLGMPFAQERRFVSPERPVEPMRSAPALLGRHAPQNLELLRPGLLVEIHEPTLPESPARGNRPSPSAQRE